MVKVKSSTPIEPAPFIERECRLGNAEIKVAYMARYPDSFGKEDEFIQSDEVFFELMMETVTEWICEGGNPTGLVEQHLCPEILEQ